MIVTLHPRAQAQVGSGLSLKRLERSCRRWQLKFCSWINEESYPLGMHQAISRPPSKPIAPGSENATAVYGAPQRGFNPPDSAAAYQPAPISAY